MFWNSSPLRGVATGGDDAPASWYSTHLNLNWRPPPPRRVHDEPIRLFMMGRSERSRCSDLSVHDDRNTHLDRGIYFVQRIHPRFGPMWPSADLVVMAVGRPNGSQIKVAGPQAANMCGLSTQVPARAMYMTDGPSRSVTSHHLVVEIRHAGRVEMLLPGTAAGMFITALLYLGDGFSESLLRHRLAAIDPTETALLRSVRQELPAWMRDVIDRLPAPA
jgi:hypothetical protein